MRDIFPYMFNGLGTKQIAHRLLSTAPFFIMALAAVFADPTGQGNRDVFWAANAFFQKPVNAALGIGSIVAYFALWWWTSLPEPPPRRELQESLRKFQSGFLEYRGELFASANDIEFNETTSKANALLNEMKTWIESNMSQEGWSRLSRPKNLHLNYTFSGGGFSGADAQSRNDVINGLDGYVEALDQLIMHGGWDK